MLGYHVITDRVIELQKALEREKLGALQGQIDRANAYIAKLERLLDHERERIEAERERADRATDSLLLQNGTPPVTAIGNRESRAIEEKREEAEKTVREQIADIYRETTATYYDDLGRELPEELRAPAAELLAN